MHQSPITMSPRFRLGAVLLGVAVVPAGCGLSTPPGDAARIDAELVADLQPGVARAVGEAVNAFGLDLFAEVADARQNTITSPRRSPGRGADHAPAR